MRRGDFNPMDFGVNMERAAFMDLMVDDFNEMPEEEQEGQEREPLA